MQFRSIQGYSSLKRRLVRLVESGKIPHALLFWGLEGGAHLPVALAFVTYLGCQDRLNEDACGDCDYCVGMQKLIHPDVKFIFPIGASKQSNERDGRVSARFLGLWRKFLLEQPYGQLDDWGDYLGSEVKKLVITREEARGVLPYLSLKSFGNSYKVLFLWLPECLHITAANALLKVIEEPPARTLVLLVSNCIDGVIGTIRSRTQQVHVPAFTDDSLANALRQRYTLEQSRLGQIVLLANGSLNRALKLVENKEEVHFIQFRDWMRACYAHNLTRLTVLAEAFHALAYVDQWNFLTYSLHLLRDALVIRFMQKSLLRTTELEQFFLERLGQNLSYCQIKEWASWLSQACFLLERNASPRMSYLDLSLKIAHTFRR